MNQNLTVWKNWAFFIFHFSKHNRSVEMTRTNRFFRCWKRNYRRIGLSSAAASAILVFILGVVLLPVVLENPSNRSFNEKSSKIDEKHFSFSFQPRKIAPNKIRARFKRKGNGLFSRSPLKNRKRSISRLKSGVARSIFCEQEIYQKQNWNDEFFLRYSCKIWMNKWKRANHQFFWHVWQIGLTSEFR